MLIHQHQFHKSSISEKGKLNFSFLGSPAGRNNRNDFNLSRMDKWTEGSQRILASLHGAEVRPPAERPINLLSAPRPLLVLMLFLWHFLLFFALTANAVNQQWPALSVITIRRFYLKHKTHIVGWVIIYTRRKSDGDGNPSVRTKSCSLV